MVRTTWKRVLNLLIILIKRTIVAGMGGCWLDSVSRRGCLVTGVDSSV
jgi:hypothetical protein